MPDESTVREYRFRVHSSRVKGRECRECKCVSHYLALTLCSLLSTLCPCTLCTLDSAFTLDSLYSAFSHSLCSRICALDSVLSIVLESRVLRVREYTDCEGTESRMQSRECMTRALCIPLLQVLQVQDSRASMRHTKQLGASTLLPQCTPPQHTQFQFTTALLH